MIFCSCANCAGDQPAAAPAATPEQAAQRLKLREMRAELSRLVSSKDRSAKERIPGLKAEYKALRAAAAGKPRQTVIVGGMGAASRAINIVPNPRGRRMAAAAAAAAAGEQAEQEVEDEHEQQQQQEEEDQEGAETVQQQQQEEEEEAEAAAEEEEEEEDEEQQQEAEEEDEADVRAVTPGAGSGVAEGKRFQRHLEDFVCENCGHTEEGTHGYTNHCSACLWSKHVDVNPGDRAASCQGLMAPIAVDTKKGFNRILQRCMSCGHERWNKQQEQDDFEAVLSVVAQQGGQPERGGKRAKGGGKGRGGGRSTKGGKINNGRRGKKGR